MSSARQDRVEQACPSRGVEGSRPARDTDDLHPHAVIAAAAREEQVGVDVPGLKRVGRRRDDRAGGVGSRRGEIGDAERDAGVKSSGARGTAAWPYAKNSRICDSNGHLRYTSTGRQRVTKPRSIGMFCPVCGAEFNDNRTDSPIGIDLSHSNPATCSCGTTLFFQFVKGSGKFVYLRVEAYNVAPEPLKPPDFTHQENYVAPMISNNVILENKGQGIRITPAEPYFMQVFNNRIIYDNPKKTPATQGEDVVMLETNHDH